jgi:hypothetical protein
MKLDYIPKGSIVIGDNKKIAVTTKKLNKGDIPMPNDFDPPIPIGTKYNNWKFEWKNKIIYIHPNFINF